MIRPLTIRPLTLFHEAILAPDDIADTQEAIQRRVLKFFCKRGWLDQDTVEKMLSYENNGFSLDASVRTEPRSLRTSFSASEKAHGKCTRGACDSACRGKRDRGQSGKSVV